MVICTFLYFIRNFADVSVYLNMKSRSLLKFVVWNVKGIFGTCLTRILIFGDYTC